MMPIIDEPWHLAIDLPETPGWYEVRALDDRWNGGIRWRAWGKGRWWIPLGAKQDGSDGWLEGPHEGYEWRGPAVSLDGPIPRTDDEMAKGQGPP
jgi:hypothetical protein